MREDEIRSILVQVCQQLDLREAALRAARPVVVGASLLLTGCTSAALYEAPGDWPVDAANPGAGSDAAQGTVEGGQVGDAAKLDAVAAPHYMAPAVDAATDVRSADAADGAADVRSPGPADGAVDSASDAAVDARPRPFDSGAIAFYMAPDPQPDYMAPRVDAGRS